MATSLSSTAWDDSSRVARNEIVAKLNDADTRATLTDQGFSLDQIRLQVEQLVNGEATALATNHLFLVSAMIFAFAATVIWLAPRPRRAGRPGH